MRTALFSNQFRLADHSRNTWCTGTEYTFCSRGTGQQLLSRKWDFHKLQIVRLHGKSVSNAIPESPTTRKYVCTTAERMTMTTTTTAIMSLAASLWFHHPWSCCPSETNGTMLCSSETSPLQPLFGVRHQTTRSPPSIQKAVFNGDPSGLPMLQRRPKKQSTRRMATSTSQQHTMPTYIHTVHAMTTVPVHRWEPIVMLYGVPTTQVDEISTVPRGKPGSLALRRSNHTRLREALAPAPAVVDSRTVEWWTFALIGRNVPSHDRQICTFCHTSTFPRFYDFHSTHQSNVESIR